jgi:hypothetical protein
MEREKLAFGKWNATLGLLAAPGGSRPGEGRFFSPLPVKNAPLHYARSAERRIVAEPNRFGVSPITPRQRLLN